MLSLADIPIPDRLRAFVRRVWIMKPAADDSPAGIQSMPIYADGCPGMVFYESDSPLLLNGETELAAVFLYGQTVAPIDMRGGGGKEMIVINFQPYALYSLYGFSAKELTDDCLDMSLLPGRQGRDLQERMQEPGTMRGKVSVLFDYLGEVIGGGHGMVDPAMAHAVSLLARPAGKISMAAVQKMLHLSPRTFERRFEQHVGVSPKLFSRIAQFQAALRHLQSGRFGKLSDIAYIYGYADQSHFIRNFSYFTGMSPLRWQKYADVQGPFSPVSAF